MLCSCGRTRVACRPLHAGPVLLSSTDRGVHTPAGPAGPHGRPCILAARLQAEWRLVMCLNVPAPHSRFTALARSGCLPSQPSLSLRCLLLVRFTFVAPLGKELLPRPHSVAFLGCSCHQWRVFHPAAQTVRQIALITCRIVSLKLWWAPWEGQGLREPPLCS